MAIAVVMMTFAGAAAAPGDQGAGASAVRHFALDGRGTLLFKPRHVLFGAHGMVDRITWGDWRGRRAHGRGSIPYNNCRPSCAEGTITRYPVRTIYRRVRTCRGRRTYIRFTYVFGERKPAGVPSSSSFGFAYLCRR